MCFGERGTRSYMFFDLSKILWIVFEPLNFIGILLILGGLISPFFIRRGRTVLLLGVFLLAVFGLFPVGANILTYLENKYESPEALPERIDGIVVLGGIFDSPISTSRKLLSISGSIERLTAALNLAKDRPNTIVVFTGGDGSLGGRQYPEANDAKRFLEQIGYPLDNVFFEDQSRNTYENAVLTRRFILPQPGEKWLLVTSAYHMPRAVAVFQSVGWENIIPYPVDYRTDGDIKWLPGTLNIGGHMLATNKAAHELAGYLVYLLKGRIHDGHVKN